MLNVKSEEYQQLPKSARRPIPRPVVTRAIVNEQLLTLGNVAESDVQDVTLAFRVLGHLRQMQWPLIGEHDTTVEARSTEAQSHDYK